MPDPTLPPCVYWSRSLAARSGDPRAGLIDATGPDARWWSVWDGGDGWRFLPGGQLPPDALRLVCEPPEGAALQAECDAARAALLEVRTLERDEARTALAEERARRR